MRILTIALTAALALTSLQATAAETRAPASGPTQILNKKAPERAKADLVIANVRKTGDAAFSVYIKNQGTAAAGPSAFKVENATSGGSGQQPMGGLQAGSGQWIKVTIWPNVKAGDKIKLYADIGAKVAESDETNNAYQFNW